MADLPGAALPAAPGGPAPDPYLAALETALSGADRPSVNLLVALMPTSPTPASPTPTVAGETVF